MARIVPRARQGRRRSHIIGLAAVAVLATQAGSALAAVSPALEARLASAEAGDRIAAIATLERQVDGARYEGRPAALIRALQRTAASTQDDVTDEVAGPATGFWLVNAVAFSGTAAEIRAVADEPGVDDVDLDVPVTLADGGHAEVDPWPDAGPGGWGLDAIRIPEARSAFDLHGDGVAVGTIDTGIIESHPDLAGKVLAWRDFVDAGPAPYDDNGHGTHVAGTIVGGTAGGAPIGVAPGAQLVVARALNAEGDGFASDLLAAAEWMTDPDGDPLTADQPAVVNNSWVAPDANDTWFRPMVRRWLELGIVPVFAAGNDGPGEGTVGNPAGYPEALAVGATGPDDAPADFSSRGPVIWQDADGLGPAAGTLLTKPDLAAPGVDIVSSLGSGYAPSSGTSMAAPHVAGVAALVAEAGPELGAEAVAQILRETATDVGAPGPDPGAGAGRLDALRALEAVLGPGPSAPSSSTPPPAPLAQPAPAPAPAPAPIPAPVAAPERPAPPRRPDATPAPRPHDRRAAVTLSAGQLRINQRISQAAIHRIAVLAARLEGRPEPPAPRPDPSARIELSAAQLRINQRISQAAVHRASVLEARIAGRRPPAAPEAKPGARITLSAGQLRINQRISQAAIRRVAALGGATPSAA